jgi:hypothetical protein
VEFAIASCPLPSFWEETKPPEFGILEEDGAPGNIAATKDV